MFLTYRHAVVALAGITVLTSCGTSAPTASDPAEPAHAGLGEETCQTLALDPAILGDDEKVELIRYESASVEVIETWLATRHGDRGPIDSRSIADRLRVESDALAAVDPIICVFQTPTPRPIPAPPGVETNADGIRVLAVSPKLFTIDTIGDAARLASQLDGLNNVEP